MYWIYLILFVGMVFVPEIFTGGVWGLDEKTIEELAIFFLGGSGLVLYLIKDSQLQKEWGEKAEVQREASRMSKDLTASYSFIGEINRKLEIFKNISFGIPLWIKPFSGRTEAVFGYMMAAIRILTKSNDHRLVFLRSSSGEKLLEMGNKNCVELDLSYADFLAENRKYFETEKCIVAFSPENINGVVAAIMVKKKNPMHTFDDPDILKAVASQALILYSLYAKKTDKKDMFDK